MINSYCLLQKWTVDFSDGYIPYIYNDDYEVYMTFLDEKRYPLTKERQQVFYKNLNEFYKNIKFDLVLVTDNPALTFINHYYHDIASIHEVPVFAAGINFFDSSMINNISQTLVIPEYIEPIATIDQILSFFPNLNTIYILNDYTETGNSVQKEIQKKILLHKQRYIGVNFIYNENLAFDEIIEDINSLPKGSAVLLGAYNQDKNGQYFSCEKIPGKLKKIKLPIFCLAQQYQDSSFVGGKMNLAQEQGRLLGEAVQKYFKTHRIPYEYSKIAQDNTKWIFSYPALEKFNLLDRKFDKNAILLNAPDKPYAKYKKQFEIAFFMICLLLISIIISIIYSFVMRKRIIRKTNEIKAKVNVFMDFIEKIPLSYIQFDNENIVTVWNKSAEMLFGYSKKEAIGKNLIDLIIKKEFQEQVLYNQRFFVKDNITYSGSEMNINKYGEEMRCEWYFTFVKDHSNILKETHCIVIDITDKKSAKNDEKILIDKLKTIKTNKERILISLFHVCLNTVSNPDTSILEVKKVLTEIMKSSQDMMNDQIIHESLVNFNPTVFNLYDLMEDTIMYVKSIYQYKEVGIINQIKPEQTVYADYEMIGSVVINLLRNAYKFSFPKTMIHITGKMLVDHQFEFTITDEGLLFPTESIFEVLNYNLFYATKGTLGENGTGIGLSTSKEFVDRNKGTIKVKNLKNGASVIVTLPTEILK